jgi:zinc/manganese transport system substrate-binding protein
MRRWRRRLPTVALAAMLVTAGCSSSAADRDVSDGRIPVVASTNVWGDVAAQIGGPRVAVQSLIDDPSQDPHTYQPSGRDELAISRAAVVIENGGGYDDVVSTMLDGVHAEATVVTAMDVARAADPQVTDNEHVWYDLTAVSAVAGRIADALARADPGARGVFEANLASFRAALQPLHRAVDRIRADHAGAPVAITEPVPLYLIESAGLHNLTPGEFSDAVEEGIDVTPSELADTLALFTGHRVDALVYNSQSTDPQTDRVLAAAQTNGIPVVPVTELLPAGEHYQKWMAGVIADLAAALDRGRQA